MKELLETTIKKYESIKTVYKCIKIQTDKREIIQHEMIDAKIRFVEDVLSDLNKIKVNVLQLSTI